MQFIDHVEILVRSGDGGNGCCSFRREKFVPRGGPDGGNGGKGGDVVFAASRNLTTLLDLRYRKHYAGERGGHGCGKKMSGAQGADVRIRVPVGTVVKNHTTGEVIADLTEDGQEVCALEGGRGGRGNAVFATPTDRAPLNHEEGEPGLELTCDVELKLMADVGLVGYPNSGKSTLLSRLSAARPKIADYPFTTLVPNLGIVQVGPYASFVMADIPGLIEGAHEGKGLGLRFLRHIERTRVLLFLIESTCQCIEDDYSALKGELVLYDQDLLKRPRLVAVTKTDLVSGDGAFNTCTLDGTPCLPISSVTGSGLDQLKSALWGMLSRERGEPSGDGTL